MPRSLLAGVGCVVVLTAAAASANGVSARYANTSSSDGRVHAAIEHNGVVYVGGSFRFFGRSTGGLIALDRGTNLPLEWPGLECDGVSHLFADPDGGYLVHGTCRVDDRLVNGFVRLTAAGQLDPGFRWSVDGYVGTAVVAGDRLLVSDYLRSAIVDRRTGRVVAGPLPFAVRGGGTGPAGALVLWASAGSQSGVVELNPTSGAIERVIYTPPAGVRLSAMTVSGGYAFFATSGGSYNPIGSVVEIDLGTGGVRPLATVGGRSEGRFTPDPVSRIVHHRGRLYLQGNLTTVNDVPLPQASTQVAAIEAASGSLTNWRPPNWADGILIAADGERLLFTTRRYQPPALPAGGGPALFALDAETGADVGWWVSLLTDSTGAAAVLAEPSRLIVGGWFRGIGTIARTGLAAITLPDGQPTPWNPSLAEDTSALAAFGTHVFAVHGGLPNRIAEYDANTGERSSWMAVASGEIRAIAVAGERLFVAGTFTAVDGLPRNGAASFDLTTFPPTLESWTSQVFPTFLSAIHVLPQAVLLAGSFPASPAGDVHRVIAVDPVSGATLPWLPVFDEWGQVWGLAGTADRIFVSGSFTTVNGQARPRVAAFDLNGRLLPWQLDDATGLSFPLTMALFEDRLYLPGEPGVAFDLASGRRTTWRPEAAVGGAFLPVPGSGILAYAGYSSLPYAFYQRVPSVSPVTGLRGTVDGSVVHLSWNAATNADSYLIEVGSASGLSNLAVLDLQSAATTFSASVVNGRYFARVRGSNEGGSGPASDELVIVVGAGACAAAPDPPTLLQATVAGLMATISWQPPAEGAPVTRYAVDLVAGTGSPATLARTEGTTISGSGPPGTYAIAVRAENGCGSSAPTAAVTVTLPSS